MSAGATGQGAQAPDPRYQQARLVVFGTDPAALEPAVTQLEAHGAKPAVFFQLPMAVLALHTHRPHVVMADVGTGVQLVPEAAAFLDHLRARTRTSAWHPPVVLLGAPGALEAAEAAQAMGATGTGLSVRSVASGDPVALAAALDDALVAAALPAARRGPLGTGLGRVALLAAVLAALLLAALLLRSRQTAAPAQPTEIGSVGQPTTVPATTATTGATGATGATGPPTVATAAATPTTVAPTAAAPTSVPGQVQAAAVTSGPVSTAMSRIDVLPSTGSR